MWCVGWDNQFDVFAAFGVEKDRVELVRFGFDTVRDDFAGFLGEGDSLHAFHCNREVSKGKT